MNKVSKKSEDPNDDILSSEVLNLLDDALSSEVLNLLDGIDENVFNEYRDILNPEVEAYYVTDPYCADCSAHCDGSSGCPGTAC